MNCNHLGHGHSDFDAVSREEKQNWSERLSHLLLVLCMLVGIFSVVLFVGSIYCTVQQKKTSLISCQELSMCEHWLHHAECRDIRDECWRQRNTQP